jgi:hypothetical protein
LDGSGKIDNGTNTLDDHGDLKKIGNNTPRLTYGLTLNADWKGFDATLFFQGWGKKTDWVSNGTFWGNNGNIIFLTPQTRDHWTPENTDAYFPKFYLWDGQHAKNYQTSSRYLQNTAYLRMKNMQFGYSLPVSLLSKFNCRQLRFYIDGENIFTVQNKWTNFADPDYNGRSTIYPGSRIWSVGMNIMF